MFYIGCSRTVTGVKSFKGYKSYVKNIIFSGTVELRCVILLLMLKLSQQ